MSDSDPPPLYDRKNGGSISYVIIEKTVNGYHRVKPRDSLVKYNRDIGRHTQRGPVTTVDDAFGV